jgi:single-stranded-DNA-specific exonuclease
MEVSGCLDKKRLTTAMVGYVLGPRINAAGRLERAMMAVEMLTTGDTVVARQIASELDRCNARRQEIERQIYDEARAMLDTRGGVRDHGAIVLAGRDWHPGVIGIVAGRLAENYHRPTVVLSLGETIVQGSARSIPGFDLYEAIKDCAAPLAGFGGHAAAAGLKLAQDQVPVFTRLFEDRCRRSLSPEQLERVLVIDAEVPLGVLNLRVVEEIERLEPFGTGNPRPLLLATRLQVVGEPRVVGERKNHLQLRLKQADQVLKAIGWNLAERGHALTAGSFCSVAFHPSINEWNSRREVQLEIKDFTHDASGAAIDRLSAQPATPFAIDRG